jgi:hypothetical protein
VHSFLIPLLKGLIVVFAITGVGKLLLRIAGVRNLAWYWRVACAAVAGQAAVSILVELVLISGAGSRAALRLVLWSLFAAAIAGHLFCSRKGAGETLGELLRADKIIAAVLLLAFLANLVVALAPSTKIDELYYHMLTPKRIIEDEGLRLYLLPIEAAIVPQMHYQISLSLAHANDAPDAGNFLSWGYSVALSIFLIGFLMDVTRHRHLSLLCGSICGVGMYGTVWHTTSGAHALGDLATVVVLAGILRPAILVDALGSYRYTLLLTTAAALAASTKLSLVPLSLVASALVVGQAIRRETAGTKPLNVVGLALVPWVVLHLPLMIWTYAASGSFWGPVLANVVGHSVFPTNVLRYTDELQAFNLGDLVPMARYAVLGFSPAFFISILWILWTALHGCKSSRLVAGLLLLQGGLVVWKFHFDFRFFGGMEYIAVIAAVLTLTVPNASSNFAAAWTRLGTKIMNLRRWILLAVAIPWLGLQLYYVRPFAEVVSGLTPRSEFLERYVALAHDFELLDQMLPHDAVLYFPDVRRPNFYAPRPVVLTALDLRGRAPVFRLAATSGPVLEKIDAVSSLRCSEPIYQNFQAVVETYRTPGQAPLIGPIVVQSCQVQSSSAGR